MLFVCGFCCCLFFKEKVEEMLGFWFELVFLFVGLLVWFFPVDLLECDGMGLWWR